MTSTNQHRSYQTSTRSDAQQKIWLHFPLHLPTQTSTLSWQNDHFQLYFFLNRCRILLQVPSVFFWTAHWLETLDGSQLSSSSRVTQWPYPSWQMANFFTALWIAAHFAFPYYCLDSKCHICSSVFPKRLLLEHFFPFFNKTKKRKSRLQHKSIVDVDLTTLQHQVTSVNTSSSMTIFLLVGRVGRTVPQEYKWKVTRGCKVISGNATRVQNLV